METLHIQHVDELESVVDTVLEKLSTQRVAGKSSVLALSGDLGAGKTTFMQVFAKKLGVTESVISPTYVIMKRYELTTGTPYTTLVHMDVYRIEDIREMEPLHFSEVQNDADAVICIEWAEKIKELLPEHTVYMHIESTGEESRSITLSEYGKEN
jgi:tRNA threonylcarbamoyladenosine biosynthesis protein TsaE